MAAQTNDKGQGTVHSFNDKPFAADLRTPRRQWPSHYVQEIRTSSAGDRMILSASCCCAGPVRDRHGRRFTTFPPGRFDIAFIQKGLTPYGVSVSSAESVKPDILTMYLIN